MSIILTRKFDNETKVWTGSEWDSDRTKAKTYEDRNDIFAKEAGKLEEIGYKWQLFLFEEFCSDYYNGLAFAIARDEEEAIDLIKEQFKKRHDREPYEWGKMSTWPLDSAMAAFVCGGG